MFDREHILDEIRRTAKENDGRPLGARRFSAETGIPAANWEGRTWARFGDALKEAGFVPNKFQDRYDEEFLFDRLVELIRDLGRFPVVRELKVKSHQDPRFPSVRPFSRIGSTKAKLADWVLKRCRDRAEFGDVIKLCEPLVRERTGQPRVQATGGQTQSLGFVYLLRFGQHYKIGRTNSAGRRVRELAIQVPGKTKLVHAIKTDDPVGVEAYWHKRFENKRGNGEWFKLDANDLKSFKLRKFM